jgi:hypothetical protein
MLHAPGQLQGVSPNEQVFRTASLHCTQLCIGFEFASTSVHLKTARAYAAFAARCQIFYHFIKFTAYATYTRNRDAG